MKKWVYHAALDDKDFEFEVELPAYQNYQQWIDRIGQYVSELKLTEAFLGAFSDEGRPLKCCGVEGCQKNAVTILHHPMAYAEQTPPRVEDIPSPVCGSADCSAAAEKQFKEEMEEALSMAKQKKGEPQGAPSIPAGANSNSLRVDHCFNCHRVSDQLKKCGRCKVATYCNAECQKAHWKQHKVICGN